MKKLLVLLAMLLVTLTATSQPHKGSVIISGYASFSAINTTDGQNYRNSNFSISPSMDFFTSDRWSMGFQATYRQGASLNNDRETYTNEYSAGFRNNYYIPITERLYLSFNGLVGIGVSHQRTDSDKRRLFDIEARITPSLNYFLTKHWAVHASFGWIHFGFATDGTMTQSAFGLDNSGSLSLGISYLF